MDEMKRLFVDMDGTLAKFNPVSTLEDLYEEGYFKNLAPQMEVVDAVKDIIDNHPKVEVFILSAVLTDSHFALSEKNAWLDEYLPEIDKEHRIFPPCGEDKTKYLPGGVRETDHLLDDYSNNLHLWEPPAKGIKLVNDINDTKHTWEGEKLYFDQDAKSLSAKIMGIIQYGLHFRENRGIMEDSFIDRLAKTIGEKYDWLYGLGHEGAKTGNIGYSEMLEFGDKLIAECPEITAAVVKARGDILSSDREVAAYGFAVNEMFPDIRKYLENVIDEKELINRITQNKEDIMNTQENMTAEQVKEAMNKAMEYIEGLDTMEKFDSFIYSQLSANGDSKNMVDMEGVKEVIENEGHLARIPVVIGGQEYEIDPVGGRLDTMDGSISMGGGHEFHNMAQKIMNSVAVIVNEKSITPEIQAIYDEFGKERTDREVEGLTNEGYGNTTMDLYRRAGFIMAAEDAFPGLSRDEITTIAFNESQDGDSYREDMPITDWSVPKDHFREFAEFEVTDSHELTPYTRDAGYITDEVNKYVIGVLEDYGFNVDDVKDHYNDRIADSHFDSEWFEMAIRMYGEDSITGSVEVLENGAGQKKWRVNASIYMTEGDSGIHGEYEFDHEPTKEEIYEAMVKDNDIRNYEDFEKVILESCVHDDRVTEVEDIGEFYEDILSDLKKSLTAPPAVSDKRCEEALDEFIMKVEVHDNDFADNLSEIKSKNNARDAVKEIIAVSEEYISDSRENNREREQDKNKDKKRDGIDI